jgi:hypothetical protein
MKPVYHIAVSTMISGIIYTIFKSWGLATASFISGIFIDLDHIIDYLIVHGLHFDVKEFNIFFREKRYWKVTSRHLKITMIFHGWEWLIILSITAKLTNWNPLVTGVLIGFGQHIILDALNNKPNSWIATFLHYSLLWRLKNNFKVET